MSITLHTASLEKKPLCVEPRQTATSETNMEGWLREAPRLVPLGHPFLPFSCLSITPPSSPLPKAADLPSSASGCGGGVAVFALTHYIVCKVKRGVRVPCGDVL